MFKRLPLAVSRSIGTCAAHFIHHSEELRSVGDTTMSMSFVMRGISPPTVVAAHLLSWPPIDAAGLLLVPV